MMKIQHFFNNEKDDFVWSIVYKASSSNGENTNIITRRRYFQQLLSFSKLYDAPGQHPYTTVMIDEGLLYENICVFPVGSVQRLPDHRIYHE